MMEKRPYARKRELCLVENETSVLGEGANGQHALLVTLNGVCEGFAIPASVIDDVAAHGLFLSDDGSCVLTFVCCLTCVCLRVIERMRLFPTQDAISSVEKLTGKIMTNSAIDKSGIKTFEGKLGINPAFGGSSGIMTGAK